MGPVEIDLLRKLLAIDPVHREDAQDFLDHEYFDSIRNIIEIEMQEISELDQEEFTKFKENLTTNEQRNKILLEARDFREQEQINISFNKEKFLNNPPKDDSSSDESEETSSQLLDNIDLLEEEESLQPEDEELFETPSHDPKVPIEVEDDLSESSNTKNGDDSSQISKEKADISEVTSQGSPDRGTENVNPLNLLKTEMKSQLPKEKDSLKKITFSEDDPKRGRSNNIPNGGALLRNRNNKFASEDPYSDQKVKTTYLWNGETLTNMKDTNAYSNSIKKEVYFFKNKSNGIKASKPQSKFTTPLKPVDEFIPFLDPKYPRQLQLVGNSIGRGSQSKSILPRVTKTSDEVEAIEKSLSQLPSEIKVKRSFKQIPKGLMEQLSTTVATTGHNTGLGWNESIRGSSRMVAKTSNIKLADNSGYKYENKFFPRRNISSKLKYVHGFSRQGKRKPVEKYIPKGYLLTKENNGKSNLSSFPEKITGSVPPRTSSKLTAKSYLKGTPGLKKSYFSPGWKQKPHQYQGHPPIYKRVGKDRIRNEPYNPKMKSPSKENLRLSKPP
eukprot:CAMPEP_0197008520 /NCGR_PEP_ID=MMETSP1380-20130617/45640_1 /TAXON_ID=5936 /ORGANISM="Euplotes crassus, Strain CT5" /LENGTH=556 /DNA_ID=CAMNT_0042429155 /DNA_START=772 /DNA_END=2444 /DNA_ORIENTATION=+